MEVGRVQERNPRFIILTPNMYGLGVAGWFSDVDLEMDIRVSSPKTFSKEMFFSACKRCHQLILLSVDSRHYLRIKMS